MEIDFELLFLLRRQEILLLDTKILLYLMRIENNALE